MYKFGNEKRSQSIIEIYICWIHFQRHSMLSIKINTCRFKDVILGSRDSEAYFAGPGSKASTLLAPPDPLLHLTNRTTIK